MKMVFLVCGKSRQAHHQAIIRELEQREKDEIYVRLMEQTREIHPGMGLRTMYEMLEPEGIGRDAFVALGLQEGFRLKVIEKKTRTTYSVKAHRYSNLLVDREFTDINQVWSSDITYFHCMDKFYYIVLLMDIYSRRIVGYNLSDNMRAENNFAALRMGLELRGIANYKSSLIHHSDKGSQYASDIYTQTLDAHGIRISMCDEVYENTHIERLNDTIKNQYLNRTDIAGESQLKNQLKRVIDTYNQDRPHKSLNGISPIDYEEALKSIPLTKRNKMKIFTIKKDLEFLNPNQLKLGF